MLHLNEHSTKLSDFHVYIYHIFNLYLQASTDQSIATDADLTRLDPEDYFRQH